MECIDFYIGPKYASKFNQAKFNQAKFNQAKTR
jgi:hypothetical protein